MDELVLVLQDLQRGIYKRTMVNNTLVGENGIVVHYSLS